MAKTECVEFIEIEDKHYATYKYSQDKLFCTAEDGIRGIGILISLKTKVQKKVSKNC